MEGVLGTQLIDKPLLLATPTGALHEAVELGYIIEPESEADVASVTAELSRLKSIRSNLLGLEYQAAEQLDRQIVELEQTLTTAATRLPIVSTEIFKMRDRRGYPRLVPFGLGDHRITLGANHSSVASNLREYYADVSQRLRAKTSVSWNRGNPEGSVIGAFIGIIIGVAMISGAIINSMSLGIPLVLVTAGVILAFTYVGSIFSETDISISAEYHGIIPDQVRDLINQELRHFDEICILAEVEEWKVNKVIRPRLDPLVIGYKKSSKTWFLLASYDTTPLEEYVAREFTTSN